jgi:hypothetical protein
MTEKRIGDIASGKETIYMWGTMRYEDVFNRPHYSKFCMFGEPRTALEGNLTLGFFPCKKHNEVD